MILTEVLRFNSTWIETLEEHSEYAECTDESLWINLVALRELVDDKNSPLELIIILAIVIIVLSWTQFWTSYALDILWYRQMTQLLADETGPVARAISVGIPKDIIFPVR